MDDASDGHPAIWIAAGTGGAYLTLLAVMFVLLFVLPFLAFRFL